ncbi:hypothetical protein [Halobacillus sp. BBL2006]|uniref:hypothetical protein n=1 Tax=Halobacillus sp. BBL2006 TaxID=1543706 RepID=UPI00054346E4|nr:hypothetical protein [Halobacillus sp. BBL2006]KHE71788.1 hypothetical protein LD39_07950 [Halobacillus sp. BBL2006]
MKKLAHSEWRLSVMALAALIGNFIAIYIVLRELSLKYVIGCLIVFALVVTANTIYVFYKRKKNNGAGKEKKEHG